MARKRRDLVMYEHRNEKLLTPRQFAVRVALHAALVLAAVSISLAVGVIGYRVTARLPWIDALLNASMILGGMGPVNPITTPSGKVFASLYALYAGLFFIAVAGVLMAPFLHRMLHRFHLDADF
jgi:sterol desaturase/sphingolipid hydroxylase (fatty acid hydroxylase superfamily)